MNFNILKMLYFYDFCLPLIIESIFVLYLACAYYVIFDSDEWKKLFYIYTILLIVSSLCIVALAYIRDEIKLFYFFFTVYILQFLIFFKILSSFECPISDPINDPNNYLIDICNKMFIVSTCVSLGGIFLNFLFFNLLYIFEQC
jgi:hypothetical protein